MLHTQPPLQVYMVLSSNKRFCSLYFALWNSACQLGRNSKICNLHQLPSALIQKKQPRALTFLIITQTWKLTCNRPQSFRLSKISHLPSHPRLMSAKHWPLMPKDSPCTIQFACHDQTKDQLCSMHLQRNRHKAPLGAVVIHHQPWASLELGAQMGFHVTLCFLTSVTRVY